MKKISYLFISLILLINIGACTGYEPIFSTSNLEFKIEGYSITGNKKLGNQIYSRLYRISKINENNNNARNFKFLIDVSKEKESTIKNSAGKILEYKITLNTNILINDYLNDEEILNHNFNINSNYKVQDQHSETQMLENKTLENLIDKTYQNILIKMSEKITAK